MYQTSRSEFFLQGFLLPPFLALIPDKSERSLIDTYHQQVPTRVSTLHHQIMTDWWFTLTPRRGGALNWFGYSSSPHRTGTWDLKLLDVCEVNLSPLSFKRRDRQRRRLQWTISGWIGWASLHISYGQMSRTSMDAWADTAALLRLWESKAQGSEKGYPFLATYILMCLTLGEWICCGSRSISLFFLFSSCFTIHTPHPGAYCISKFDLWDFWFWD